jgi:hypothetical protein
MSSIAPDVNIGLLTLVGPITQVMINEMKLDTSPLSAAFGPRTTLPSIISNKITEDTASNTCTYRGIQYRLVDVQISSPIHNGYNLPGTNERSQAELILTFYKASTNPDAFAACILVLPIYITPYTPTYDIYLSQIIVGDTQQASYANLQSLFYSNPPGIPQVSFTYKSVFQSTINQRDFRNTNIYVVVFPRGIHTSQATYNSLLGRISGGLPLYSMPASVLNGDTGVVSSYSNKDGAYVPSVINSTGTLPINQYNVTTQPFSNIFQYFLSPPKFSTMSSSSAHCILPSQYKCMPLQSINKNNINFVKGTCDQGTVVKDVAAMNNKLKPATANGLPPMTDTINYEDVVKTILFYPIVIIVVGYILKKLSENPDE